MDKFRDEWDLRCMDCKDNVGLNNGYLGYDVGSNYDLIDLVKLTRIIKLNNVMPKYILVYLLKHQRRLWFDLALNNNGGLKYGMRSWLDEHWSHDIRAVNKVNNVTVDIPKKFILSDLEALKL
jgi:hypothetical protein